MFKNVKNLHTRLYLLKKGSPKVLSLDSNPNALIIFRYFYIYDWFMFRTYDLDT